MRKIKIYTAISLNGMIAKQDGDIDWLESLPNPDNTDYGYSNFIKTVDTTIQGKNTYQIILNKGVTIPTKDLKNYVFTNNKDLINTPHIEFIKANHLEFCHQLKNQEGRDIWLMGGGQLNSFFLNNKLVDELYVFVMPIIIENGIKFFEVEITDQKLELLSTEKYQSGAVLLRYFVHKN